MQAFECAFFMRVTLSALVWVNAWIKIYATYNKIILKTNKIGQRWLKMFEKLILIFSSACVHSIGYVHLRSQKTLVQWQHFILMIHQQLRHQDRVNSNTGKPHTTRFLSLNNLQSLHKTHNERFLVWVTAAHAEKILCQHSLTVYSNM